MDHTKNFEVSTYRPGFEGKENYKVEYKVWLFDHNEIYGEGNQGAYQVTRQRTVSYKGVEGGRTMLETPAIEKRFRFYGEANAYYQSQVQQSVFEIDQFDNDNLLVGRD